MDHDFTAIKNIKCNFEKTLYENLPFLLALHSKLIVHESIFLIKKSSVKHNSPLHNYQFILIGQLYMDSYTYPWW
ncbi:MAG: hypothetical protein AMJ89_00555 [candidate division Zixibacteria bacterium SM23_73]|nr:MAG: hypothetical protein AMJ89_00555 [candidate division Zixibacteria bacterium SM23_73]